METFQRSIEDTLEMSKTCCRSGTEKIHHHHYPMADNHLSEDEEDGEAEEWEDVLEIVEVRSSNSFHVLIGSSLVQIYQIYLSGGFTPPLAPVSSFKNNMGQL